MLILLPPSETKRDGGAEGEVLDLGRFSFSSLTPQRRAVIAATRRLAKNLSTMSEALRLGPSQRFELVRNRTLGSSPTMPAIERYTGVLYDALDVETLNAAEREFLNQHVAVHSAMFGLVAAADPIPAYRLSFDTRLPGLALKKTWRDAIAAVIADYDGLVLDLRSEGYAELGPAPQAHYLRVVAEAPDGRRRALNHFNKKGKGEFVRAIVRSGLDHPTVGSLLDWAAESGIVLTLATSGELELTVPEIVADRR